MADKEHLVRCSLQEYGWAKEVCAQVQDIPLEDRDMYIFLLRRDRVDAAKGPVSVRRVLGEISVVITLLDADMRTVTGKVFYGSMTDGVWNPDDGQPGIIFEHDLDEDETYDGVLLPYKDMYNDKIFLHEPTTIDPADDTLPPDLFS
jgi:hypothetical protein